MSRRSLAPILRQTLRKTSSVILSLIIGLSGLAAAAPLFLSQKAYAAPTTTVYDAVPSPLPPNVISLAFESSATSEFGDYVHLTGTDRALSSATVTMSAWARHSDFPNFQPATASGWSHPLTLNIYSSHLGANGAPDQLLASVTKTASIPWRPEGDPTCPDTGYGVGYAWRASDNNCYNGYAFNETFDMSGSHTILPDNVIVSIAYNTDSYGAHPIGVWGPYDYLNVGAPTNQVATAGNDNDTNGVYWNTSIPSYYADGGAAGSGLFRLDTNWSPNGTLPFQITATSLDDVYVDSNYTLGNAGGHTFGYDAYASIPEALAVVASGGTVHISGMQALASTITLSKPVTLTGGGTIDASGTTYALLVSPTATGTTISGLNFVKTDSASGQNLIGIQANNVTISNNTFTGQYNLGGSAVSRAIEVSGVTGVDISGNTISHMRQPAYINAASGTISNNLVKDTRGWVVVSDATVTFTGNSWGTGSDANSEDIAIIPNSPAGANNYPNVVAISQSNNNAVVENQVSHQKTLGAAPIATPTVSGGTSTITLPATNDLMGSVTTPAGTVTVSVLKGTIVTASSNSWDGTISAPKVVSVNVPAPSGYTTTIATAIEVGSTSTSLSFDHAARLVLPSQTGKLVGFIPVGGSFTAISTICGADDQITVDAQLTALSKNECKYDNGSDMIIWTKHFTTFVAYSQSAPQTSSSTGSNSSASTGSSSYSSNTTQSGTGSSEVLGASSTPTATPSTSSATTTQPSSAEAFQPPSGGNNKFLGIAWYIWLIGIAGIALASYIAYAYLSVDRK